MARVGVTLRQETRYPDEGRTRLLFRCERPIELGLRIRHPYWATAGFDIEINRATQSDKSGPGSYAVVTRKWESGDVVDVVMPFSLRTEGFRDNPSRVAVMYGPFALGGNRTRAVTVTRPTRPLSPSTAA